MALGTVGCDPTLELVDQISANLISDIVCGGERCMRDHQSHKLVVVCVLLRSPVEHRHTHPPGIQSGPAQVEPARWPPLPSTKRCVAWLGSQGLVVLTTKISAHDARTLKVV